MNPQNGAVKDKDLETEFASAQQLSADSTLDEQITPDEELEISGYQPEQAALIDREFLMQREGEPTEQRETSENPLVRFAIAALLVGGIMGFGWMLWAIFFAAKPAAKPAVTPTPTPSVTPLANDEASRLKAELALRNQASRTEKPQPQPIATPATPSPTAQKTARRESQSPPPPRVIREPAPPPRIIREPAPPPRIIRERVSVPVQSQQPQRPSAVPTPVPAPQVPAQKEPVDPFARWNQLATLGQQTISEGESTADSQPLQQVESSPKSSSNASSPLPATDNVMTTSSPAIPVVAIGSGTENGNSRQIETSGERGILNRTSYSQAVGASSSSMQVQIGTSAVAKVLMPMIWAEKNKGSFGRFAVELQEDVLSTDNRVALPKGTILITEVDSVTQDSKLVKQSVVAIVYPDSSGSIRQETIPKDAILIRGEDNRPLIARGMQDKGSVISQQDILIGLLGAAGRAGEIFNQNQTQSSTVISSGGFNSQTISTTAREPNLLAAAVEGFFKPMSERLAKRAEQTTQEMLNHPDVAIIPAGTKVSVFFNTFFEITR